MKFICRFGNLRFLYVLYAMKSATVYTLKKELNERSKDELVALCLRLAKFKKENKELLTYLLFESDTESHYVENVKAEITDQLSQINASSSYLLRKGVRKTLKAVKKYIRYSQRNETEVELLLDFCVQVYNVHPTSRRDKGVASIIERQLAMVRKKIEALHEDLQFDYRNEIIAVFGAEKVPQSEI